MFPKIALALALVIVSAAHADAKPLYGSRQPHAGKGGGNPTLIQPPKQREQKAGRSERTPKAGKAGPMWVQNPIEEFRHGTVEILPTRCAGDVCHGIDPRLTVERVGQHTFDVCKVLDQWQQAACAGLGPRPVSRAFVPYNATGVAP